MKHSRLLFGFMTVLGIALLSIFFTVTADGAIYIYIWGLLSSIQHLFTFFGWFCLLGGTVLLTAGICGIGRQYFRDDFRDLFSLFAVLVIPFCITFAFLAIWMGALTIAY